eukprot:gb/GECH01004346.1/.p1 GENE.gb/GECH01004346.1/~~gb/GECH01004346.1/.p1  ORF type:complete len:499 (+),score=91.01 gb/GECH01004346.1/:1-1497(+)
MENKSPKNENSTAWYSLPLVLPPETSFTKPDESDSFSSRTSTLGFAWLPDIQQFLPELELDSTDNTKTFPKNLSPSSSNSSSDITTKTSLSTLFWQRIRNPMVVQGKITRGDKYNGWCLSVNHVYDWSPNAELMPLPRLSHLHSKNVEGVNGVIQPGEVSEDVGSFTRGSIGNRREQSISFSIGDTVTALVVTCDNKTRKLNLSTNNNRLRLLSDQHYNAVHLGLDDQQRVPIPPYDNGDDRKENEEDKDEDEELAIENRSFKPMAESYNTQLLRDESFHNPYALEQMIAALGLDASGSLFPQMRGGKCPRQETYKSIEKMQSRILSDETLRIGVDYARQGHPNEALKAYDKSLEYNYNNTDAHVARGAALANKGEYEHAKEEFSKALSLDPDHPTAGRYLSATKDKIRNLKDKSQGNTEFSELIAAAKSSASSSKIKDDGTSSSSSSSESSYSRRSRKKHKKKHRHHHRKDKKRRHKKHHDDEYREKKRRRKEKKAI